MREDARIWDRTRVVYYRVYFSKRREKLNRLKPPQKRDRLGRHHPGVELRANLKSISHRCHLEEVALFFEVAFVWELTKETIHLPLGCLQGGIQQKQKQVLAEGWRLTRVVLSAGG